MKHAYLYGNDIHQLDKCLMRGSKTRSDFSELTCLFLFITMYILTLKYTCHLSNEWRWSVLRYKVAFVCGHPWAHTHTHTHTHTYTHVCMHVKLCVFSYQQICQYKHEVKKNAMKMEVITFLDTQMTID